MIPTAETVYLADVEDDKGGSVPETDLACAVRTGKNEAGHNTIIVNETSPVRPFKRGESMTEEIVLNRLYDLSKPGKYRVWVRKPADVDAIAKSNVITITIAAELKESAKHLNE